jgi:hypothetical protein
MEQASVEWCTMMTNDAKQPWLELAAKVAEISLQRKQAIRDRTLKDKTDTRCSFDDLWLLEKVLPVEVGCWKRLADKFTYRNGVYSLRLLPCSAFEPAIILYSDQSSVIQSFEGNFFVLAARLRATLQHNGSDLDFNDSLRIRNAWDTGVF